MMGIAVGEMGLSLETFLSLTPFEFQECYSAYLKKLNNDREWEYLKSMRVARRQVFRTLCPPPGKQISEFDLWELPGDNEIKDHQNEKTGGSTKERYEELKEKWNNE
ncbi:hypothetical protein [Marinifilum flexuosum]|uniref:Uncharacterized protein n=1 Tax=Marinifilum flexuosum TaxID=1117708 RepID=A0A419X3H5_9BACT|nr:hypothetical protein [Marinifilum flexuosum]RKE02304.1 hypothetical protein BXY64_2392 [Marinifilum flexuosum]